MKKISIAFFSLLFLSSMVFADDFVPLNKLDIDVPDYVQYDFDGNPVDITLQIDGAPARAYLIIETQGLADTKFRVRNGRIGWHTVSSIDTTVYFSAGEDFAKGTKYITWPGVDNDGNAVPEGKYTYHIWAFDNVSTVQPVMPMYDYDRNNSQNRMLLTTTDENGVPYPKPWISTSTRGDRLAYDLTGDQDVLKELIVWGRWKLGNDPYNNELIETSQLSIPEDWNPNPGAWGRSPFDPEDHNYIFYWTGNRETVQQQVRKFKLVPNDLAEEMTDWGQDLKYTHEITLGKHTGGMALLADTYLVVPVCLYEISVANPMLLISDLDGNKVEDIYLTEWDHAAYVQEHGDVYQSAAPQGGMGYVNRSIMVLGSIHCFHGSVDPIRYLESGDYEDVVLSINEEGDGYQDKGWSLDNPFPDHCYAEDPPWNYCAYGGEDGFITSATSSGGPISWALYAPDFTAIDYCVRAGETDSGTMGIMTINNGGDFDGVYVRPKAWRSVENKPEGMEAISFAYLGMDSDKGTISTEPPVSVAAAAPSAFAVEQSSPNPANPTTTISFTIPEAGNVSVDVFNVAGQKVDTLVNDFMDAGPNSVMWDGSSRASGVYFYTVTSGEFSKTMKMTLLH